MAAAAGLMAGCKSSGSEYIAPRVEGRVLDAQTHLPIERVAVQRLSPGEQDRNDFALKKGAESIVQSFPTYTDRNGRFVIDSEKALVLFAQMNWFSVDISFEHSGYEGFVTNYTLFTTTNTPSGEPLVDTGDILLQRIQDKRQPKPL